MPIALLSTANIHLAIDISRHKTQVFSGSGYATGKTATYSTLILQRLPGDCGIVGNHLADDAAQRAQSGAPILPIPLSRVDAARELRNLTRTITLSYWHTPQNSHRRLYSLDTSRKLHLQQAIRDVTQHCCVGCE